MVIDQSPFPRSVNLWMLLGSDLDPANIAKCDTLKIIDCSIFGADPWRAHTLMLIAIGEKCDVLIAYEPRKMMTLANGLAVVGLPKVIDVLNDGGA